jgi:arginase
MGHGAEQLVEVADEPLPPEHMLYLGLKDLDQAEVDFIREQGIAHVTMHDVTIRGLSAATSAIARLCEKVDTVWVSMDMDSIDQTFAPGVAMQNEGGFSRREITTLMRHIGRSCDVVGMDLVEMLPANDVEGKTAKLAIELAALALGSDSGQYQAYMGRYEGVGEAVKRD